MQLYDASLPIRKGMAIFPGDPQFAIEPLFQCSKGDRFNLAVMTLGTHLGTHVDPPAHYLEGAASVDRLPLESLIGPGVVLDMTGRAVVDRRALESSALGDHVRVMLKTDNSARLLDSEFHEDYVHLTEDGAAYLVERAVRLIGTDYLSIEQYHNIGAPVHKRLLNAGVVVVEGVFLLDVPPGPCEIYCLPLRVEGADGAPARVVIRR